MDPISISAAFAAVKGGISAGKSLMNMTKELSSFFDASDAAQADHTKKKNSVFASANEEAMTTYMAKLQAKDAEEELRNYLVNTRGLSSYNELQSIRREIRIERKEAERKAMNARQEKQEQAMTIAVIVMMAALCLGSGGAYLWWLGLIEF